jgi:hypothetical protein
MLNDVVDPRPLVTVLARITGAYALLWWVATAPARRATRGQVGPPTGAREMLRGEEPPL